MRTSSCFLFAKIWRYLCSFRSALHSFSLCFPSPSADTSLTFSPRLVPVLTLAAKYSNVIYCQSLRNSCSSRCSTWRSWRTSSVWWHSSHPLLVRRCERKTDRVLCLYDSSRPHRKQTKRYVLYLLVSWESCPVSSISCSFQVVVTLLKSLSPEEIKSQEVDHALSCVKAGTDSLLYPLWRS